MIWLALAFMLVASLGGLAYAAARGWRLFRTFRRTSRRAADAVARVTDSAARAEERAAGLTAKSETLSHATEHLRQSLAELAVIRAAAAEPRSLLATIRGAVPRK